MHWVLQTEAAYGDIPTTSGHVKVGRRCSTGGRELCPLRVRSFAGREPGSTDGVGSAGVRLPMDRFVIPL